MGENRSDKETIEALVDNGLRNLWYPLVPSWSVDGVVPNRTAPSMAIIVSVSTRSTAHKIQ